MRPPRGGGSFRGNRGGGGFRGRGGGGFGGGRGGGFRDEGPPSEVVEVSTFVHACEGDAVTKLTHEKIPYFNAPIYLQNKTQIGKVDEIFGPINESYFSVKVMEGIVATSYSQGDKFYIDPAKLLQDFFHSQRDRNQLFLEVEDVEAGDLQGVAAEDHLFVAGDLPGAAEDLREVGVVASGEERDFRNTALPISCCHYFQKRRTRKSHSFMLAFGGDMWFCGCLCLCLCLDAYFAEEFVRDEVNYRCLF